MSRWDSSPGSMTIASVAPSRAAKKQFSATGPTVKPWTSTRSACLGRLLLAEALVHPAVERVADRDVDQHREQADGDRLAERHVLLEEPDLCQHERRGGGGAGPQRRALPGRRLREPLLAAVARGLLLRDLRFGLAAGAAARLDRAGRVSAVLGAALALGLGHGQESMRRPPRVSAIRRRAPPRASGGCAAGRSAPRAPPPARGRRARRRRPRRGAR